MEIRKRNMFYDLLYKEKAKTLNKKSRNLTKSEKNIYFY